MHEAVFASDRDICVIASGSPVVNISATDYHPCVESLIPMASDTHSDHGLRGSTVVVAIVVPAVLVTIVLSLIVAAFILPRFGRGGESFSAIKGQRMQQRLEEINKVIKTQNYYEWCTSQRSEKDSKTFLAPDPLCAICLEHFAEDAQIRGLRCSHAFHAHCLDEWFSRFNEFCPLCHRTIIPGKKVAKKEAYPESATVPLAFIV
ncbi:hypothetical protein HBH70_103790 [Parastagonospora nodorum]|nr:hypothetical protein HBH53_090120 [Parastagonospora nodorum]KAH3974770.1 hypothetical protein HBH52_131630 [Parastagonospora nodorum]KAH3991357.1 hypothetical protein HBI10_233950 [Parastagonospora nodorum]KAH4021533.1 hypothetical protein HBI13_103920 [Parastagonospora nodorum]KAH4030282.1 hypothetical protein HBI09_127420 [Parastagonospora nodorum]